MTDKFSEFDKRTNKLRKKQLRFLVGGYVGLAEITLKERFEIYMDRMFKHAESLGKTKSVKVVK